MAPVAHIATLGLYGFIALLAFVVLKTLYNISPFHPLAKYPGPILWRASRVPASIRHAKGDLYKNIAAIHAEYGPTVRIAPDELSFSSPEAWPQIYNSRPQLPKTIYHFGPPNPERNLPESMITATDDEHMRLRRLVGPAFLGGSIREVEPVMQRYVDQLCSQLEVACKEGSQNMVEWFLWTLNDVIGQLALDQEFQCLEKRRMHPWPEFLLHGLKATAALNQFRRFGISLSIFKLFQSADSVQAQDKFFNTAETSVHKRLNQEHDLSKRPDIVGLMLREMKGGEKLSEREILANSILVVGGGAETTSTCLSGLFYHLLKTPRVLTKLKDEIRHTFKSPEEITLQAVGKMDYLKATVDEALRIFPVASYISPRVTPKDGHVVAGEVIPGNTCVSMGQWYMGRSPELFNHPLEFKPERWLDSADSDDRTGPTGMTPDETLRPFSLGPRNCIGKLVALAEARLVVAKLLWHFDMELDGPQEDWVDNARFYILWELQALQVKLVPVKR